MTIRMTESIRILPSIVLIGTIALTSQTKADDNVTQNPEIVITASKIAETVDDTLAPVTIITRKDIEQQQPRDIQDLFRNVPGLSLTNSGGLGKSTAVYMRGTETNHVVVLIDGVRVGSATKGTTAFQHIPVEQIERIEVVRGPRSHLYGSNAIGGVIQIFTRRAGETVRTYGSLGYGSHNTIEANGGVSGSLNATRFSVNVGKRSSDGINSCGDGITTAAGGCFDLEPDEDGYKQKSIAGRLSHDFDNGLGLEVHSTLAHNESEFDGTSQNSSNDSQRVLGFKVDKDLTDYWDISVATSRSWDLNDNYNDGVYSTTFDTIRDNASLQNDFMINDTDIITIGADYQFDKIESTTKYDETERYNAGAFGQYIGEFGSHNVQFSLRADDNEQFGGHLTGNAAWGYSLNEDMDIVASYGTAYNAPTFNYLYFPGFGSSSLQPEESKSYEVSLRSRHNTGSWSISVFQSYVKDLIAYDSSVSSYANVSKANIPGLEAEANFQFDKLNVAANFSYVNPKNETEGSNEGNQLSRRAKWRSNLNFGYQLDDIHLGADIRYVGKSFENLNNTKIIGDYITLDLRGAYEVMPGWKIELSANNVLDKTYKNSLYYNQDGRNFFLKLRYASQ